MADSALGLRLDYYCRYEGGACQTACYYYCQILNYLMLPLACLTTNYAFLETYYLISG
jgi:hypothetical protein